MLNNQNKIHIITLGCSKNLVDSEHLLRQIESSGYSVSHNSDNIDSGTVIINTCGFIQDARQESIDTILEVIREKLKGKIQNVYVIGCLSEIYKNELQNEIPEVDQYFGVNNFKDILSQLGIGLNKDLINERVLTTPDHYAYLKISEGCDRTCSFCSIPVIRGKHISVPVEQLKSEALNLANSGVKELILIAQDITYYGWDLYKKPVLALLLEELVKIEGIEWIRLHYAYPHKFPADVTNIIKTNPKICKYLDLPFQHISDKMLSLMRRGNNKEETLNLIKLLRNEIPGIALRTTLVVGHPGETDADFKELLDFVNKTRFDRLGVFTYSHEEFSYSYNAYKDDVPEEIKQSRYDAIMEAQQKISFELNKTKIGKKYKVMIDREEPEYWIGRTEFDSPEVDNEVLIYNSTKLVLGNFYNILITQANEYDLIGEIIN